jgi:hypothetical protein
MKEFALLATWNLKGETTEMHQGHHSKLLYGSID